MHYEGEPQAPLATRPTTTRAPRLVTIGELVPAHRKLLSIVEASYRPAGDFDTWAQQVSAALTGLYPGAIGAFAIVQDADDPKKVHSVHAPEAAASVASMVAEMSAEATPDQVRTLWGQRAGVATLTEQLGCGPTDPLPEWLMAAESFHRSQDTLGLFFERADGRLVTFNLPLDARRTLTARTRAGLVRVLSHVALAERLRQRSGEPAAVLSASGKVLHAEGPAKRIGARTSLRAHALRIDRARGRQVDDAEGIELWRGMVDGLWSVVDEFDTDGRRFFVARENVGRLAGPRALTKREQQVLALVLSGRSNKLVAYELGLSPSTVSLCVRSILAKTGAPNRAALLELTEALRGTSAQGGVTNF